MGRVLQRLSSSWLLAAVVLVGGCAVFPEAIKLPDNTQTLAFATGMTEPAGHQGAWVQWGGVIAAVENRAEHTVVEMVYYPLRAYGRPIISRDSMGRFRVHVNGFLDPMVYRKGRAMTFSGKLAGTEEGTVGEHNYIYPKVMAKGFHLWDDIRRVEVATISVWPYSYWGGWHSGWHRWHLWPYRQRVIIRERNATPYDTDVSDGRSSSGTGGRSAERETQGSPPVQSMQEYNKRQVRTGKAVE